MIQFERVFDKTARGDARARAMELADAVAKGEAKPRRLFGRLSKFQSVRMDSNHFLLLTAKPGVVRVYGVCKRESIKFEALERAGRG